jgi:hypothetical protein
MREEETMANQTKRWIVVAGGLSLLLAELVIAPVAEAIVGRPATPVSAAGVARRTCRRTVAVTSTATASAAASQQATAANQAAAESAAAADQAAAAANQAAASAAAATPAPTPMVASLPDGCVSTGEVFQCGNVYYKPYLQGTTVVYAQVPGP